MCVSESGACEERGERARGTARGAREDRRESEFAVVLAPQSANGAGRRCPFARARRAFVDCTALLRSDTTCPPNAPPCTRHCRRQLVERRADEADKRSIVGHDDGDQLTATTAARRKLALLAVTRLLAGGVVAGTSSTSLTSPDACLTF